MRLDAKFYESALLSIETNDYIFLSVDSVLELYLRIGYLYEVANTEDPPA